MLATDLTADATGSRGIKRSRSEDQYGEQLADPDVEDGEFLIFGRMKDFAEVRLFLIFFEIALSPTQTLA